MNVNGFAKSFEEYTKGLLDVLLVELAVERKTVEDGGVVAKPDAADRFKVGLELGVKAWHVAEEASKGY
jgi:hypothetical protein